MRTYTRTCADIDLTKSHSHAIVTDRTSHFECVLTVLKEILPMLEIGRRTRMTIDYDPDALDVSIHVLSEGDPADAPSFAHVPGIIAMRMDDGSVQISLDSANGTYAVLSLDEAQRFAEQLMLATKFQKSQAHAAT